MKIERTLSNFERTMVRQNAPVLSKKSQIDAVNKTD